MPKVSIITINFNNFKGLQKTIESVSSQNFSDYEYIVIDGGSTDGSIDVIKNFETNISYWVSEKDNGIYHAMNKGTVKAQGDYCYYLNSGDLFFNENVLKELFGLLNTMPELIAGDVEVILKNGQRKIWNTKERYRFSEVAFGHLPHQGFFFHSNLFKKYGFYNEQLKIISDWEYLLKLIAASVAIKYTGITFAQHFFDGISQNPQFFDVQKKEREIVLKGYSSFAEDLKELELTKNFLRYFIIRSLAVVKRRFYKR